MNQKGKAKQCSLQPRCHCLGGTKAGARVCVSVWERMWGPDGFVKSCAGMHDAHPKETGVFEFCFFRTRFFLCLACSCQFHEKRSAGCCRVPAPPKETKSSGILGTNPVFWELQFCPSISEKLYRQ